MDKSHVAFLLVGIFAGFAISIFFFASELQNIQNKLATACEEALSKAIPPTYCNQPPSAAREQLGNVSCYKVMQGAEFLKTMCEVNFTKMVALSEGSGFSMYPTIPENSTLLVCSDCSYAVGDVVIYEKNGKNVAHRIWEMNSSMLKVKGDNNPYFEYILRYNVRGIVVGVAY